MHAVIRTGGKQYLVAEGQTITIERLPEASGKTVTFADVLMIADKEVQVGNPTVKGATVTATIVNHDRAPKVTGVKFHNKVRYHRTYGHRQHQTTVKITGIKA